MDNTAEQVLRTLRELVAEGGYTIGCNECIQNPGCFEGEPQEILYWHSLHMQGISAPIADMESDGYYACQFPVDAAERAAFNLSDADRFAILSSDSQGFWHLEYSDTEPEPEQPDSPIDCHYDTHGNLAFQWEGFRGTLTRNISKSTGMCVRDYYDYSVTTPTGAVFDGTGFSPSPLCESDEEMIAHLLTFLCLQPGDTDRDYFAEYTPEQIEWAESSECETAAAMLSEITQ